MSIHLSPVGHVVSTRSEPHDDGWDSVESRVELCDEFSEDALQGIEAFSHVEIVFLFHLVPAAGVERGARHPRGNPHWPLVGIFAQRAKDRPNRLGVSVAALVGRQKRTLLLRGLDAVDGTPVLDIKPVMSEFLPRGEVCQPPWSHEVMRRYWQLP